MHTNEEFMREALKEAEIARSLNEVPVGAVIVRNEEIIARAHNLREHLQQASAHAEMLAIEKASEVLNTWSLDDCDLYVTLEPCMMCTGVIGLARIRGLYYGTADPKGGCTDTLVQVKQLKHIGTYPRMVWSGILQEDCARILREFFAEKRQNPRRQRPV
jgi:tRNA(adenine34) deaminase